ncbi:DUF1381 domain-containing protein [Staphylococcus haemolyticus]|uniref:DUF1381 domain-containing protein n=1 Tax=Staphylococcus haemolyticus TaxID=1283 RepID=UPI00069EA119|nr:DUF1381 domain-containing protein [Staphylococcus haemolyticus]
MPQFLIREFTDSTGHIHTDIEKARTNETLSIVDAEDKEEALKVYKTQQYLMSVAEKLKKSRSERND